MANRDILERFMNAAFAGDMTTTAALMHPEFMVFDPASLPYGGTYRGMDGVGRLFAALDQTYDTRGYSIHAIIGEPGGQEFGIILDMDVTKGGRSMSIPLFDHCVVRDGKVAKVRVYYWDTKALLDFLHG